MLGATVAVVARITLAAAFGLSAGAKLAHPGAFADGLTGFGVPAPRLVARALPPVEAAVAILLVAVRREPWPAFLAVALLAVFTGFVVANLVAGGAAPCPCFGPPGTRPVSASTVARNGYLIGLAVLGTGSTAGASAGAAIAGAAVSVTATLFGLRRIG